MTYQLSEEELMHLESLIKSPVYKTFEKMVDAYRAQIHSQLLTEKDANQMFSLQGRLIGVQAIFNLPTVHAKSLEALRERQKRDSERQKRVDTT